MRSSIQILCVHLATLDEHGRTRHLMGTPEKAQLLDVTVQVRL
jgi:hypothetical protein